MNVEEVVTGITVCHNTNELLERAYTSIRKHRPEMNIIIVDTSDRKNPCYGYVLTLRGPRTKVMHVDKNIGHGKGLCMGINGVQTPYFLIFDSDIEMFKSPISKMLNIIPNQNLVTNIGFEGTHSNNPMVNQKREEIKFPLKHPDKIERFKKADIYTLRYYL